MSNAADAPSSALAAVLRWEASGGTWVVLRRSPELMISLRTCTAGEEAERLTSGEADVAAHIGSRERSDD